MPVREYIACAYGRIHALIHGHSLSQIHQEASVLAFRHIGRRACIAIYGRIGPVVVVFFGRIGVIGIQIQVNLYAGPCEDRVEAAVAFCHLPRAKIHQAVFLFARDRRAVTVSLRTGGFVRPACKHQPVGGCRKARKVGERRSSGPFVLIEDLLSFRIRIEGDRIQRLQLCFALRVQPHAVLWIFTDKVLGNSVSGKTFGQDHIPVLVRTKRNLCVFCERSHDVDHMMALPIDAGIVKIVVWRCDRRR